MKVKRFIYLIFPLLIPFTISCNNGNNFTVKFDSNGGSAVYPITVKQNQKIERPKNPTKEHSEEYNYYFVEWQLNGTTFDFSTPITSNITLKAKWNDISWWNDDDYINGLKEADIGIKRGITINSHLYLVHLIDINHDVDINNRDIHTTWEFLNCFCDSNNQSIKIAWNDDKGDSSTNFDFETSTLNKKLNLESDPNSIINMLPSSLREKIKIAKKEYAHSSNKSTYAIDTYQAKLFPLSHDEITETRISPNYVLPGEGTTYTFYKGDGDTDDNRAKTFPEQGKPYVCNYWFRTPCIFYSPHDIAYVWWANPSEIAEHIDEFYISQKVTVAPAFCI